MSCPTATDKNPQVSVLEFFPNPFVKIAFGLRRPEEVMACILCLYINRLAFSAAPIELVCAHAAATVLLEEKKGYTVIKERESIQIKYPMINPSNFIVLHTFNMIMKASSLNWNTSPSED